MNRVDLRVPETFRDLPQSDYWIYWSTGKDAAKWHAKLCDTEQRIIYDEFVTEMRISSCHAAQIAIDREITVSEQEWLSKLVMVALESRDIDSVHELKRNLYLPSIF